MKDKVYQVGNAKMEILSSPDNTLMPPVKDFNQVSLVIRMEIEGQVILWGGDIKTYDLIQPDICLVCGLDWVWLGKKSNFMN